MSRIHAVQFYGSDLYLQTAVADFFSHAVRHREPAAMIARPRTYEAVQALTGDGAHIQFVDIADALGQFMDDGMPDPVRFERAFESLLGRMRPLQSAGSIWIFGEAVDELCRTGNYAAALRMEELWNAHFTDPGISVMCGYSLAAFDSETDIARIRNVCRAHTHVLPPDAGSTPHLPLAMVYVIDDDESVRRSLARLLASLDVSVQIFASAEEFLAEAHDRRDACLIVDVQLLGMSGTELQRRMADAHWTLPVIAMSGAHGQVIEMEAMHMGARAFLRKPFDLKALREALDRAVGHRS